MANEPIEGVVTDISDSVNEAQSGFKAFIGKHPRTAKVVGYTAVAAAVLGAVSVWNARNQTALESVDETSNDVYDTSSEIA